MLVTHPLESGLQSANSLATLSGGLSMLISEVTELLIRDHTSRTTPAGVSSRGALLFREAEPKAAWMDIQQRDWRRSTQTLCWSTTLYRLFVEASSFLFGDRRVCSHDTPHGQSTGLSSWTKGASNGGYSGDLLDLMKTVAVAMKRSLLRGRGEHVVSPVALSMKERPLPLKRSVVRGGDRQCW